MLFCFDFPLTSLISAIASSPPPSQCISSLSLAFVAWFVSIFLEIVLTQSRCLSSTTPSCRLSSLNSCLIMASCTIVVLLLLLLLLCVLCLLCWCFCCVAMLFSVLRWILTLKNMKIYFQPGMSTNKHTHTHVHKFTHVVVCVSISLPLFDLVKVL